MPSELEWTANAVTTASVWLAGRNSVHTWWTGIAGSALFILLFFQTQLYADATLQVFFIATSLIGWWRWLNRDARPLSDIRASHGRTLWTGACAALIAAAGYGWLLASTTNAYAPFADSLVLTLSVMAQILLMRRRLETWWFWLLVNAIAVPLYYSRGLAVTAAIYVIYLVNAFFAQRHWKNLVENPINKPTT